VANAANGVNVVPSGVDGLRVPIVCANSVLPGGGDVLVPGTWIPLDGLQLLRGTGVLNGVESVPVIFPRLPQPPPKLNVGVLLASRLKNEPGRNTLGVSSVPVLNFDSRKNGESLRASKNPFFAAINCV